MFLVAGIAAAFVHPCLLVGVLVGYQRNSHVRVDLVVLTGWSFQVFGFQYADDELARLAGGRREKS